MTFAHDPDEVHRMAREAEQAGDRIATAQSAIRSVKLHGGAFGLMCQGLIPQLADVTEKAATAYAETHSMLLREADALRGTAADFAALEEELSQSLGGIQ